MGFPVNVPIIEDNILARKTHEKKILKTAWRPKSGENAKKTPIENPNEIECGESGILVNLFQ